MKEIQDISAMSDVLHQIKTISKWEIRRFTGTMSKEVLPIAVALFIALILVSGFAQQSGIHLQDDMYKIGTDSEEILPITAGDSRFTVYKVPSGTNPDQAGLDLVISSNVVYVSDSDKGQAALTALTGIIHGTSLRYITVKKIYTLHILSG